MPVLLLELELELSDGAGWLGVAVADELDEVAGDGVAGAAVVAVVVGVV